MNRLLSQALSPEDRFMLHVDGGLYRLLGEGKSAEDRSRVAIYEHLHPFERGVWTRPWEEFELRFSPISHERAHELLARDSAQAQRDISQAKAQRRQNAALAAPERAGERRPRLHSLGFLFSPDLAKVALIRKASPAWQAGKLNGIGGKAEPGETSLDAMSREFREEAGLDIPAGAWNLFGRLGSPDFEVHCYRAVGDVEACQTLTAETVEIFAVDDPAIASVGLPGVGALIRAALGERDAFWRCDYGQWALEAQAGLLEQRQA